MFPAAEEIIEYFDAHDIVYRVQQLEDSVRITADVLVDYTSFSVMYLAESEDNDISVRVPHFVRFLEKDLPEMLRVANEMNARYRFAKFTVNEKIGSVTVEYDFPEHTENLGEAAAELFRRFMQIAEEAYPHFMRAIWERKDTVMYGNVVFHDFEVE